MELTIGNITWTPKGVLMHFIGAIIFQCTWQIAKSIVNVTIIKRRDTVAQLGCQLQKALGIPEWLCVIADEGPGITDESLRAFFMMLIFLPLISVYSYALLVPLYGTFWNFKAIGMIVVFPLTMAIMTWTRMTISKRELLEDYRAYIEKHR
ncbi:hypothetical protein F4781DRAFT_331893 [Annulohypoxylon bovei var. microspora]|nr:hypothetical protein F4781DRAFT_331893 [Annulohypoxylon bovei var. microspora]